MANWVLTGLLSGIKTSRYPSGPDETSGLSPGRPLGGSFPSDEGAEMLVERCPVGAIARRGDGVSVDEGRCVHCFRCREGEQRPGVPWADGYEWAARASEMATTRNKLDRAFGRSLHIRFLDAGSCGACMSEARQLNNPYYNMHRLGFLITPTPRMADVLIVAGPVSNAMRIPLVKAYEAMPTPKRVMAIGACAISGGVFGPSFIASEGVSEIIPADVVVPGCPPPPAAILHGLLVLVDRKPPSELISRPAEATAGPI